MFSPLYAVRTVAVRLRFAIDKLPIRSGSNHPYSRNRRTLSVINPIVSRFQSAPRNRWLFVWLLVVYSGFFLDIRRLLPTSEIANLIRVLKRNRRRSSGWYVSFKITFFTRGTIRFTPGVHVPRSKSEMPVSYYGSPPKGRSIPLVYVISLFSSYFYKLLIFHPPSILCTLLAFVCVQPRPTPLFSGFPQFSRVYYSYWKNGRLAFATSRTSKSWSIFDGLVPFPL